MAAQAQTADQTGATIPLPPSAIAAQPPPTAASPLGRFAMGGASTIPPAPSQQLPQPFVQPVDLTSTQSVAAAGGGDSLANLVSSGHIDSLVNTVIAQEGGSPRGVQNNPGNIKFTGAPGQIDSGVQALDGGTFASYQTPEEGRGAIDTLIMNAAKGHLPAYGTSPTVQSFLQTYQGKRMSPGMAGNLQQVAALTGQREQEALQGSLTEINALQQRYAKVAGSAAPGSDEEDAALARQMELSERAADTFDKLASAPPKFTPLSMMQKMGSLATVIAVLGGLKSRQPLTAGLNAAGKAMEALNQGNYDQYKIAYDQWKTQSELTVQSLRAHAEAINQILSNKRLSQEEKNSELNALAVLTGNTFLKAKLEQGAINAPFEMQAKLVQLSNAQAKLTADVDLLNARIPLIRAQTHEAETRAAQESIGLPANGQSMLSKIPDKWDGEPNQAPPGVDQSIWASTLAYVQTGKMPSLGFQPGLRNAIIQLVPVAQRALGIDASDMAQKWSDYAATRHGEYSLGTRMANLGIALHEAEQFIPVAENASDAVSRTEFPTLNKVFEAAQSGSGNQQVVQLYVATNALMNAYAQVAARGGVPTDMARKQAQEILNAAYSQGQYKAAAQQMMVEIKGAMAAPPAAVKDLLGAFSGNLKQGTASSSAVYNSPDDIYRAFDAGKISKDQAKQLLIQKFGFTQ